MTDPFSPRPAAGVVRLAPLAGETTMSFVNRLAARCHRDGLVTRAQGRALARTQNTSAFNDIHDCVNTAWINVAQTLESHAADSHAVLLDDALDTLDSATQRLTQAHRILDHLLDQIGEDLDQPLPA
ncbi:hypothetical protein [Streptomyces xanthochromogenes]|uniref:hypothetical protein n=1 Tax=Streptomyces xanthochromogenes TaxID=67384 RepID=UPI0037F10714